MKRLQPINEARKALFVILGWPALMRIDSHYAKGDVVKCPVMPCNETNASRGVVYPIIDLDRASWSDTTQLGRRLSSHLTGATSLPRRRDAKGSEQHDRDLPHACKVKLASAARRSLQHAAGESGGVLTAPVACLQ